MSLNCFGAPTNSFRILLASSIAAMKSPTLKPKLIVKLVRSLSYAKGRKDRRERERVVSPDDENIVCVQPCEADFGASRADLGIAA
jgi:hypothetical protein